MTVRPIRLRTENIVHPLNIDTKSPRLSWELQDFGKRGNKQTAWQVELEDSSGKLLWDSGMRTGNECSIECGGSLLSFSAYRWRVCCRDEKGTTGVSDWAFFETAALNDDELAARWISHPNPAGYYEGSWESGIPNEKSSKEKSLHYLGIYCSKIFSLSGKKIQRARALVSGAGLYCLYLNGRKVGDELLAPAQTDYAKRILYSVYDIGPFIDEGKNEQCVTLVLGNGRHIALYGFGKPRGLVQILLEAEDGSVEFICSDETWRAGEGPLRENSIFNGECYDARLKTPQSSKDLSETVNAEVVEGYKLQAAMIPPIRTETRIAPVKLWKQDSGFMYDFGQNFSGAAELRLDVPRGTDIRLSFAELIHPDGSLNPSSNREARSRDRYIARGGGLELWQPTMTYHGFRYLLMEGFPGVPDSETVTGLFFHTEVEREGDFYCSHPLFNVIHRNILWGQLSNLMGVPTDSPQRDERHGWLGDALLSSEECIQNFGPAGFYEKFIQDIADTQNEDGSITDVAPKFWMKKPADPAWGSAFISIAWTLYRFKDDRAVLEKHYPAFRSYIAYLEREAKGFLIETLGTFGDWCAPGMVVPKKTGLTFTSSWYFQHDTGLLADIADVLGDGKAAARYRALQANIIEAMNKRFRKENRYESLPLSPWDFPDQTSQALALCSSLVTGEDRKVIAATLDRLVTADSGDHVGTGIHGTRYLLEALTDSGYAEKAFILASQETFPGWGYMIKEGATTLWERWEKIECVGMNSHNHIMLGSIDLWFYNAVAGLSLADSGFREILFTPGLFKKIDYARARLRTPCGTAAASWERNEKGLTADIRIPPGVKGSFRVPEGFAIDTILSTPADGKRERIPFTKSSVLSIGSGWYHIECVNNG